MPIYNSVLETVGRTPLIKLNRVTEGLDATIAVKAEFFNPLGSVKDRIGLAMIEAAEKAGKITKDTVIVAGAAHAAGAAGREAGADAGRGRHEGGDRQGQGDHGGNAACVHSAAV